MKYPVFDAQTETYGTVKTEGAIIKPWLKAIHNVIDEAKFEVDENGFHVTAVDAANVIMIDTSIKAGAFESFDVESFVQGFDVGKFIHSVRRARVNSDDSLFMEFGDNELRTQVSRGYNDVDVISNSTVKTIDPDAIRKKPDIPELEFENHLELDTDAFLDAVNHELPDDGKVELNSIDGMFCIKGEGETIFDGVELETEDSYYSKAYIKTIYKIVKKVKPETVTLEWSPEYPVEVTFESEYADYKLFLAPRISS